MSKSQEKRVKANFMETMPDSAVNKPIENVVTAIINNPPDEPKLNIAIADQGNPDVTVTIEAPKEPDQSPEPEEEKPKDNKPKLMTPEPKEINEEEAYVRLADVARMWDELFKLVKDGDIRARLHQYKREFVQENCVLQHQTIEEKNALENDGARQEAKMLRGIVYALMDRFTINDPSFSVNDKNKIQFVSEALVKPVDRDVRATWKNGGRTLELEIVRI